MLYAIGVHWTGDGLHSVVSFVVVAGYLPSCEAGRLLFVFVVFFGFVWFYRSYFRRHIFTVASTSIVPLNVTIWVAYTVFFISLPFSLCVAAER